MYVTNYVVIYMHIYARTRKMNPRFIKSNDLRECTRSSYKPGMRLIVTASVTLSDAPIKLFIMAIHKKYDTYVYTGCIYTYMYTLAINS